MGVAELTKSDVQAWRHFLKSDAGMKGLLFLREKVPSIVKGLPHEVQYDAGFNQGFSKALDSIGDLLVLRKEKEENLENP